jgi:hypothetical protein
MRRVLLAAALGIAACEGDGLPVVGGTGGDPAAFAQDVQPVLKHCAYLGCHGREGMTLVLYSLDYLRLRHPDETLDRTRPPPALDERVLEPEEIEHNRRALTEFIDHDDPKKTRLYRVQIPIERGGLVHAGIVVFDRPEHPDLLALERWIASVRASR